MKFIGNQKDLDAVLKQLEQPAYLAVDTEADSLHHYFEKLCLIQVGTGKEDYVIDPLAGINLDKVMKILSEKILICHGADFDLRMLAKFCGLKPKRVFDTMLAAQFLGYPKPSLASLVETHYKVQLAKANQKADWSKRPLTDSMLEYASNDTHYLHGLRQTLEKDLKKQGRFTWFEENCRQLLSQAMTKRDVDNANAWRIKGCRDLAPRSQCLLKELWTWREKEAKRRDRPRFKILGSDQLIGIVKWITANPKKNIKNCPSIPQAYKDSRLAQLEKAVQKGLQADVAGLKDGASKKTTRKKGVRLGPEAKTVLQALKRERKKIADKLKCDPSLVASNATLEKLLVAAPKSEADLKAGNILLDWQIELTQQSFLQVLNPSKT